MKSKLQLPKCLKCKGQINMSCEGFCFDCWNLMNQDSNSSNSFYYWCYNNSTGTVAYPASIEVCVMASDERESLKKIKKAVRRDVYHLFKVDL